MIGFLQPWALLGLPLVALPLLLHLVQRRDPPSLVFPAVRYLLEVSEEHQRRLRIRNLLLLVVRTALVLLLVLAASAPTVRGGAAGAHAPTSLVIVVDNSASSGAVDGGAPVLAALRTAARRVLARATTEDRLWLLTADGIPRRGAPAELRIAVDSLAVDVRRLDLSEALARAEGVLAAAPAPGGVVVISDFQSSAITAASPRFPVIAARVPGAAPANTGVSEVEPGPQPWSSGSGTVGMRLTADGSGPTPITVTAIGRTTRSTLATRGEAGVTLGGLLPGWWVVQVSKPADEFRADDERAVALHVVEPARVSCDGLPRHLAAACAVLAESGRVRPGNGVSLGGLGPGPSIVTPPVDPAGLGALNRALERRGAGWRFGALVPGEAVTDSSGLVGRERITRRVELVPAGASGGEGVLGTAGGRPWLVRTGQLVLLGSRLEPDWTSLPLSAAFPGFVDALVNRVTRGEAAPLYAAPGAAVLLPERATVVTQGDRRWPVEGGAAFRARETGVYFLLSDRDTVGSLSVGIDPRESLLMRATDASLESAWPGVRVVDLEAAADAAFAGASKRSLQSPLLWLVVVLAAGEMWLAGGHRRTS